MAGVFSSLFGQNGAAAIDLAKTVNVMAAYREEQDADLGSYRPLLPRCRPCVVRAEDEQEVGGAAVDDEDV